MVPNRWVSNLVCLRTRRGVRCGPPDGAIQRSGGYAANSHILGGHFYLSRRGYALRSTRLCSPAGASKQFSRTALTSFPNVNTSTTRRSRALSEEVRRQFWLPDEMLDAIYGEPVVQHFYDRDEILAFKQRWSRARIREEKKDLSHEARKQTSGPF
jgi:hypothetical protein